MNRAGWTRRIGAIAVGAMLLTTGCGLFASSAAHKPTERPAATSSAHAGSTRASHQDHGGSAAPVGPTASKRLTASSTGAATNHSHAPAPRAHGAAASASSVAGAVQSMFRQIAQSSGAQTSVAEPGKSTGTTSTSAGQSSAQSGVLQNAAQSRSLKPSEAKIVQPYVAALESLRAQYLASLSALYNQARADYHQGKGSKLAIEAKYIPQIVSLENSAQDQVNSILFALRSQLEAHGYPTTEMDTLRTDFYSEVQQEIATLRG